jgi:hypothetical protein
MQKIIKGLLMTAAMLLTEWQLTGNFETASILVASAFLIGYYAKNWWFPSASTDGVFDWKDVLSAILVAISVAIPESIAQIIVENAINWKELLTVVGTVVFTYFTGTYFSKAKELQN